MNTHNPKRAIEDLQIILSSPTKKIGFLFGAGICIEDKDGKPLIPGVKVMTETVIGGINQEPQKTAVQQLKTEIELIGNFNIETLLSKISEKERALGVSEKLNGLDKKQFKELRKEIENTIKTMISVHKKEDFVTRNLSHYELAKWIKNADRQSQVEIFTVNYDYLLEIALEKYKITYFDGFVGSYKAFFCPEWIEDFHITKNWTKLWKLHGSLGWEKDGSEIIRSSRDDESAMIYPSYLKYDHSRKQPYLSYMDRLSHFLIQEDAVLIICGYSFNDEHINEMICTALSRSRSSHVFVLKNSNLDETDNLSSIAKDNSKISVYAKNKAYVGCNVLDWELAIAKESSPYFDKVNNEFQLGDFKEFTNFLSSFNQSYKINPNE